MGFVSITMGVVLLAAISTAIFWPPSYRSTATILMEEPAVPRDLVRSTITSYADQRVQVITQRVMATSNLVRIIDQHKLYPKERSKKPVTTLVDDMRENIKFTLISADVVDPRSGRPMQANIAFTLLFDYGSPRVAQRVLSELVSLYLDENARTRQEKVAETTKFLSEEATKLEERVKELEKTLAEFKNRHAGSLPDDMQVNMQRMDRLQGRLRDVISKIGVLEERKIFLRAQLAQIDPHMSFRGGGEEVLPPRERLRLLKSRYVSLNARYGAAHPDVIRLRREIEGLEREIGPVDSTAQLTEELELARDQLASLQRKYTAEHPDVVKLRRKIGSMEMAVWNAKSGLTADGNSAAMNPAFIQLKAQLTSIDLELDALNEQEKAINQNIETIGQLMAGSAEVESRYRVLVRDYNNATAEYQQVKTKQMEAELGRSLEAANKGGRLSVIEPPTSPVEPISPNRVAILVLGFVFSIGSGVGLASLLEAMSTKVHGARHLSTITGSPPLAIIPEIVTTEDRWRRGVTWSSIAFVSLLVVAGGVTAFHLYIMPLDVLWFSIQRRMNLGGFA